MIKFRPHNSNDALLVEKWLNLDEEHSKTSSLSFWLPPENKPKGVDYLVIEDEIGVIGYIVLENILRIHCQFPPSTMNATETERLRKAIPEFMSRLKTEARPQYKQLIFESVSGGLVWFLRKLGFRRSKNEIVCNL